MLHKFLPDVADQDEQYVVASFISSLIYLKQEAQRENQPYIAYAIEDAILFAKTVQDEKFSLIPPSNNRNL